MAPDESNRQSSSSASAPSKEPSASAPSKEQRLTDSQITWCSGTAAGFAATFAKQPIQRVKWIRQTSETFSPYSTIFRQTVQKHGAAGFFGGSAAAVYRNVPHSILVYSLYPHCASLARKATRAPEESFLSRFAAGYVTMVSATLVTHPLDTLRVRVSIQSESVSFLETARRLHAADGVRGFYGGFGATLLGAGPRGAIGFGVFETAKPRLEAMDGFRDRPAFAKVVAGYLAGLLSESFVYPLDTVRRRQQALGAATPLSKLGVVASVSRIYAAEGGAGLFKGISLNLVKNPIGVAISFAVNDHVKELLGYGSRREPPAGGRKPTTKTGNVSF